MTRPRSRSRIGGFEVVAQHVIHPGPTVGYRISADGASVAYLPDHEPALGARRFPEEPRWTSGFDLASGVDLLIHDGQYSDDERAVRIGWGHSSVSEAVAFAELARVRRLILFHHDPSHSDAVLDELTEVARARGPRSRLSLVARALSTTWDRRPRLKASGHQASVVAGLRLGGRAAFATTSVQKSTAPLVPQTHRQGLAAPVLDRPLAPLRSIRAPFVPIGLTVGGELRLVDRELPLGESTLRIIGRQVREEELKEPWIAKLRRRTRRSIEPGAQGGRTRWRDRKDPSTSTLGLTRLGDRPRLPAGRLAVQEGVRKRPEVPERGLDMLLEVVRRRWSLAGKSPRTRYDVGVRRSVDIVRNVPYTSNYSVPPPTDQVPGKFTPGGRPSRAL